MSCSGDIILQLKHVLEDSDEDSNEEDEDEAGYGANATTTLNQKEVYPANFLFGFDQAAVSLTSLHPPSTQIPIYWKIYLENCEVLLRVLHTPAAKLIVNEAQKDASNLSRSNELLMFAIYFAAITSMTPEEVYTSFGGDRAVLLSRYEMAVQRALVNAGFLNSQDSKILQGFVLYLVSLLGSNYGSPNS